MYSIWQILSRLQLAPTLKAETMPKRGNALPYRCQISGLKATSVVAEMLDREIAHNGVEWKREKKIKGVTLMPIVSIKKLSYQGYVYNLEVEEDHSYLISNGLSAHNCVFNGAEGGYVESSPHTAMDIYGRSKSLGESESATIIRTSIIGEELSNKLSLVEWVKSQAGKSVNGYLNHFWNGITCLQFAKICDYMLKNDLFWKGQ
jgi:hypothetical protein